MMFRPVAEPIQAGYHGSMMRGAFGHALRRLACVMRRPDCHGCPIEQSCIYTSIFEPRVPPSAAIMAKYPRAPNPFVLIVDPADPGESGEIHVGLRLFGPAIAQHAVIVHAFREAAASGLGSRRLPYRLDRIVAGEQAMEATDAGCPPPAIQGPPAALTGGATWDIVTPMRLTVAGRPMTPDRVDVSAVAMGILRRAGLMLSFYGPETPLPDFHGLKDRSRNLRLCDNDLRWHELHRRSNRQKATQSISGLVGRIGIDCTDAPEWGRWLAWAPILHLGKNTSMGLGRLVAA